MSDKNEQLEEPGNASEELISSAKSQAWSGNFDASVSVLSNSDLSVGDKSLLVRNIAHIVLVKSRKQGVSLRPDTMAKLLDAALIEPHNGLPAIKSICRACRVQNDLSSLKDILALAARNLAKEQDSHSRSACEVCLQEIFETGVRLHGSVTNFIESDKQQNVEFLYDIPKSILSGSLKYMELTHEDWRTVYERVADKCDCACLRAYCAEAIYFRFKHSNETKLCEEDIEMLREDIDLRDCREKKIIQMHRIEAMMFNIIV
jgi:hypothetical protein